MRWCWLWVPLGTLSSWARGRDQIGLIGCQNGYLLSLSVQMIAYWIPPGLAQRNGHAEMHREFFWYRA